MKHLFHIFITLALITSLSSVPVNTHAQNTTNTNTTKSFTVKMRATSENAAIAGQTKIIFWGTQATSNNSALFQIKAQTFLDRAIGKNPVNCTIKKRTAEYITAHCINRQDIDLGLLMIQNGHAIVNREDIYDTIFEIPYLEAEENARNMEIGIWEHNETTQGGTGGNLMLTLGFILFILLLAAFTLLSFIIMRGFEKTIDAQNRNMDLANKERALRDKERQIFANMLDSEIKSNKSKIEAYLIVYDEMLKSLNDPNKQPKYQSVGDIVQQQPALSRSIFDRNTDKLDVLGKTLASDVIHFYARIKTKAEYINIEPEMPIEEALEIVEKSITNATRLNNISDRLIDAFAENGLSSHNI